MASTKQPPLPPHVRLGRPDLVTFYTRRREPAFTVRQSLMAVGWIVFMACVIGAAWVWQ